MFGAIPDPKIFDQHPIWAKQGFGLAFSLQSLHATTKPRPGEWQWVSKPASQKRKSHAPFCGTGIGR